MKLIDRERIKNIALNFCGVIFVVFILWCLVSALSSDNECGDPGIAGWCD